MSVLVHSGILCSVGLLGVESVREMYMFAILSVCLLLVTCMICSSSVSSCDI